MKKPLRVVIANAGLTKNNIYFSKECLEDCVKNITESHLYITDRFNRYNVIGNMDNFEYKDGKILADVYLRKPMTDDQVIRCAYNALETQGKNPVKINECRLIEGGLIEKIYDTERDLI